MSPKFLEKQSTRREMLRNSAGFAGSALLAQLFPASLLSAGVPGLRQQAATAPTDRLAAMRAQMGAAPHPGATAGGKSHVAFRAWRKRCGVERARWQNRGRHVSSAGLAEVERNAHRPGRAALDGEVDTHW